MLVVSLEPFYRWGRKMTSTSARSSGLCPGLPLIGCGLGAIYFSFWTSVFLSSSKMKSEAEILEDAGTEWSTFRREWRLRCKGTCEERSRVQDVSRGPGSPHPPPRQL